MFFVHWVADFALQSDKMAREKSSNNWVLAFHCMVYSMCFIVFGQPMLVLWLMSSHFVIDYFTSRMTKKLWAEKRVHAFFVVIGFDQFLHALCILFWLQVTL